MANQEPKRPPSIPTGCALPPDRCRCQEEARRLWKRVRPVVAEQLRLEPLEADVRRRRLAFRRAHSELVRSMQELRAMATELRNTALVAHVDRQLEPFRDWIEWTVGGKATRQFLAPTAEEIPPEEKRGGRPAKYEKWLRRDVVAQLLGCGLTPKEIATELVALGFPAGEAKISNVHSDVEQYIKPAARARDASLRRAGAVRPSNFSLFDHLFPQYSATRRQRATDARRARGLKKQR